MAAVRTIAFLALALGVPPLLTVISRHVVGNSTDIATLLPFDGILWALFAFILIVVVRVERQPLSSIGLRPPDWQTLVWGLLLMIATTFVLAPATIWIAKSFGLPGYEIGLRRLLILPAWYRVFLAISAGVVEETLYRGYAVERLASLTGSYLRGGSIAVVAFSLAHIPGWGTGEAVVALVAGAVATAFYVWRRDLIANGIAHVIGDTVGLVLLPPVTGS